MKNKPATIVLVAALLAAGTASWVGSPGVQGAAAAAPTSFSVFESETESGFVDLGKKGFTIGDEGAVWTAELRRGGQVVGHDSGVCFVTSSTIPAAQCLMTAVFDDGQIAMQVVNDLNEATNVGIILGGTGAYTGAQGSVQFRFEPSRGGHTLTFNFGG
jgi:hypothetical protein